jgi:peptide deformylase
MAIKEILKMGNPLLRQEADLVLLEEIESDNLKYLVEDMKDTLEYSGGIGLAAPQIGVLKQLVIIKIPEDSERYPESKESEEFILFNPVISYLDKTLQGFWEGCLSIPGLRGFVERPRKIRVDYTNENSLLCSIEVEDFQATVFQHELDHLFGFLYVDRMKDIKTLKFEEEMQNINEQKEL